jgi:hypothetical protein
MHGFSNARGAGVKPLIWSSDRKAAVGDIRDFYQKAAKRL